jgi:hypothetical protein
MDARDEDLARPSARRADERQYGDGFCGLLFHSVADGLVGGWPGGNPVARSHAWKPDVERLALPKSVDGGNLGRNKLVIRWMSVCRERSS